MPAKEKAVSSASDQQPSDDASPKEPKEESSLSEDVAGSEGETASGKKESKGCCKEEILAVLAHELGHWKLSHNLQNLTVGEVR